MSEKCKYNGLTDEEIAKSRMEFGANLLIPPPGKSAWMLFFEKFKDPVIGILMAAALISAFTGAFVESLGILLAIFLATGIAFLNEYKAGKEFDILNKVDDSTPVKAIRNGGFVSIPKQDLVVGDIIFVETGEEMPADATVLEAVNLHVDQSKFTGEPEPVVKMPSGDPAFAELGDASYAHNLLLRGSSVLEGYGYARISSVGSNTEIGRTAVAAAEITDIVTPLQKQLNRLGKVIALTGTALSAFLLVVLITRAFLHGTLPFSFEQFFTAHSFTVLLGFFMIAITLIVVAVPEGLAMSVTLSLAYSMRRMTASQCLVRKLHACETIGAATVICTDKTGTLTMNQMRLKEPFFPSAPDLSDRNADQARFVCEAFSANSTANLSLKEDSVEVIGNPTEGAALIHLHSLGISYMEMRNTFQLKKQFPFTTERKMMATFGHSPLLNADVLHIKGAPEFVLGKCTFYRNVEGIQPLTDEKRAEFVREFANAQKTGCRTLAFAFKQMDSVSDELSDSTNEMVYLGFISIADPVRPEVPPAVQACRDAGINVIIVTGDTPGTAGEIGRQIGLWNHVENIGEQITEGREFDALSDSETKEKVKTLHLIARARPNDKMKLVKALQDNGEVVAVTGDGTNDAPALNYADVGVAMGKTGTAIAREAADIILLDDSFRTIVSAVLWGRSLYLNIQRFILFQLTINVAAVGIALLGPFIGVELPLTVIQMLWINLIMDTLAALALATEPPNAEVMRQKPRDPDAFIVTPSMAWNIFGTALFFLLLFVGFTFYCEHRKIMGDTQMLTLLFTGFVLLQFWNLLNAKCFGSDRSIFGRLTENPIYWLIASGILVGQVAIVQFGGSVFRTVPLNLTQWLILLTGTSIVLWTGELYRFFRRLRNR